MNHSMVPYLWISSDPTPNKNVLAQPFKKHCQKAGYSKEYWSFPIFQRPPIFVRCQSFKPRNWSLTVCHIQDYWHGLFRVKCLNYRFTKVIHRRLLIPFVGIGFSWNACIAVSWKTYMFETALTALNYTEKNMSPLSSMEMGKMNAFCSWKMMKLTLI